MDRRALLWTAAMAAALLSCRDLPDLTPSEKNVPPPQEDYSPDGLHASAAERKSLGTMQLNPSYPTYDKPDAGLLSPEGDLVSAAVNGERSRLGIADDNVVVDGGNTKDNKPIIDGGSTNINENINNGGSTSNNQSGIPELGPLPAGAQRAVIAISAGVSGELVPCGCSPDLRGGLPREAALLASWRKDEPGLVYFDAGDLLFESAPQGPSVAQAKRKAATLAAGELLLGASARVVGARDLLAGAQAVADGAGGVPLLDSGAEVPGARASLLLHAGPSGVPVGIFAAGLGAEPEKAIAARARSLREQGAKLVLLVYHPSGDRAVGAAQRILPAARAAGVDLIVLGHRDDPALDPDVAQSGNPPLLALEGHGQSLLLLSITIPQDAKPGAPLWLPQSAEEKQAEIKLIDQRAQMFRDRLASADAELKPVLEQKIREQEEKKAALASAHPQAPAGAIELRVTFRPLSLELPDDPAAKALVASYDQAVAEENLAAAKKLPAECPRAKKGEPAFIGVSEVGVNGAKGREPKESCASCHASEAAFWARTRHARAYETLVAKGKQFSFDCIQCHVTGWQQPGGVCRIDRTAFGGPGLPTPADRTGAGFNDPLPAQFALGRQGVQCESCHGPASEHAKDGSEMTTEIAESTCKRCHDFANSPHFDMNTYRPWVIGPGHGEPLAQGEAPRTRGEIDAKNKLGPNPALHEVKR